MSHPTEGTMILMIGFLGFNGGSVGRMTERHDAATAALVLVNTVVSAAGGGLASMIINRFFVAFWSIQLSCNGAVRVFRQNVALEDAIGSHTCSLEANMRVTNGIPLGSPLLLPAGTVTSVQTLKVRLQGWLQSVLVRMLSCLGRLC